jgi:streptogramin lyase
MLRRGVIAAIALSALAMVAWAANEAADVASITLQGIVVDEAGKPVRGATVTAFDAAEKMSVSVYSKEDGTFRIAELDAKDYTLRARLLGMEDASEKVAATKTSDHKLVMSKAKDLNMQRPANDRLDLLKFEDEKDATNFRMMCVYCHQVGTEGFRSPEEPVDWEVMVTRMDGFRGLYEHTQKTLVDKLLETYGLGAEDKWPAYTPPEAPKGEALDAEVSEWQMGKENDAMIHDLEVGIDGKVYTVDMTADAMEVLDPVTGKREIFSIPGGKAYDSTDAPIKGPHSVEVAPNGDMWLTLALSGEMAKFDPKTRQYTLYSGAQAPRKRGGYPHTLRVDAKGEFVWWTDAASPGQMGVASINTKTGEVKQYKLPDAGQVRGGGAGGESAGVTPYGLSIAPDGKVWYTKLNGERVGRVDPSKADGDPLQIVEWAPPVKGPRRLEVAPDGKVWVPGWASGDIASFDEKTEQWKVYKLPYGPNSMPYALSVHPKTGEVWVNGTGADSMLRFNPKTETFTEYRMPTRVTYTREVEFDQEGDVWVCNSNYPVRHVENRHGSVIQVAIGGKS